MKTNHVFAVAALAFSAMILIVGCTAGMKSLVSPSASDLPSKVAPPPGREGPGASRPAPEGRSGPRPEYAPPEPPDQTRQPPTVNLSEKDEVVQAGLKFAEKSVAGVKHAKTCYSRLTGMWYLFLYVPKGKRVMVQQWAWNTRTKEWEHIHTGSKGNEIEADKHDYHLKSELPDEKCFPVK